ncbi:MAG: phytanoyl-CoA dioxygenase family protein [Bacteroidetes bacterium]|nr:phytanoyl-CoA dioxygenase family protein [Bacteroidota bacterium]
MSESFEVNGKYPLAQKQVEFYQKNGFVKLKEVLSAAEVAFYNDAITKAVQDLNKETRPFEERDTYAKAFLQITNIWQKYEHVKDLIFSPRLARIAAELMEIPSVRLYHDQALFKEAGGGFTPWHADQYYWPLETDRSITAWIPLQETSLKMGALEFSAGSQNLLAGRDFAIGDDSEKVVNEALKVAGYHSVVEPFDLGEVSFHAGWTFHRASPNQTTETRKVMCIIYMDANMKLKKPVNGHQQLDWEGWCPGVQIGEVINSPINPILFDETV